MGRHQTLGGVHSETESKAAKYPSPAGPCGGHAQLSGCRIAWSETIDGMTKGNKATRGGRLGRGETVEFIKDGAQRKHSERVNLELVSPMREEHYILS